MSSSPGSICRARQRRPGPAPSGAEAAAWAAEARAADPRPYPRLRRPFPLSIVVKLENIHKIYDSSEVKVHAVRGVSADIATGDFVALMGASGSGKSTLMNLLGCLDRPTEGRYLLDGTDVSHLDRNELADIRNKKLGFVFQGYNLLARTTALENVELPMLYGQRRLPRREMRERAMHCLEIVG